MRQRKWCAEMWKRFGKVYVLLHARSNGDSPCGGHTAKVGTSTDHTHSVIQCVCGLRAWPIDMCSDKDAGQREHKTPSNVQAKRKERREKERKREREKERKREREKETNRQREKEREGRRRDRGEKERRVARLQIFNTEFSLSRFGPPLCAPWCSTWRSSSPC